MPKLVSVHRIAAAVVIALPLVASAAEVEVPKPKAAAAAKAALKVRRAAPGEIGKAAKCAVMGTEFTVGAETQVIDYGGKAYFFCCDHCVADFKARPKKYASP